MQTVDHAPDGIGIERTSVEHPVPPKYERPASYSPKLVATNIGKIIQEARRGAGLTQRELAGRIGLCTASIGLVESGHRPIHLWKWNLLVRELPQLKDFAPTDVYRGRRKLAEVRVTRPHLGLFIRQARSDEGLSQRELSDKMGIGRSNVALLECGARAVQVKRWDALIKLLPKLLLVPVRRRGDYIEFVPQAANPNELMTAGGDYEVLTVVQASNAGSEEG